MNNTLRGFAVWLLCISVAQNAYANSGCAGYATFSAPQGTYGVEWLEEGWDCVCEQNDGFYYTGEFLGYWTFSPFDWDFKMADAAACPDQAPDCTFSVSLGPMSWAWVAAGMTATKMRKVGALLVSVVLVFPAAVLAIAGIVGLLGSLADITMSASMQVLLSGACLFVSFVAAHRAYSWIIRRVDGHQQGSADTRDSVARL